MATPGGLLDGSNKVPVIAGKRTPLGLCARGVQRTGAHLSMEKVKGVAETQSIKDAIGSPGDFRRLMREHLGR